MSERQICYAKILGSCLGCDVLNEALLEMRRNGREPKEVLDLFSNKRCPEGLRVQLPEKEPSIYFVK